MAEFYFPVERLIDVSINGSDYRFSTATIGYADLAKVAMCVSPSVTWRIRDSEECGTLGLGDRIAIRRNMVFTVTDTNDG